MNSKQIPPLQKIDAWSYAYFEVSDVNDGD